MKDKFVSDFFDAMEIVKLITRSQLDLANGTVILSDMLSYVRKDLETMDADAKKQLDGIVKQLDVRNSKRKEEIIKSYPEPEDTIEEAQLKAKLLSEDHKRYRQELFWIQDLAFNKGWLD